MRRRPAYFFFSRRRRYLSSYAGPVLCLLRLLLILGFSSFSLRDTAGASLMRPIRRHLGVTWSRCGGNAEQAPLSSRAFPESPSPLPFFPRSCRRMRPNKVSEERPERLPSSPSPDKEMRRAKTRGSGKNKRGCHLKNTRRREGERGKSARFCLSTLFDLLESEEGREGSRRHEYGGDSRLRVFLTKKNL